MCSLAGEMSDEEIKKKTLASAVASLEGKSPGEKAAIIHQHLGRREMTDVIIETMKSNPGMLSKTPDSCNISLWLPVLYMLFHEPMILTSNILLSFTTCVSYMKLSSHISMSPNISPKLILTR